MTNEALRTLHPNISPPDLAPIYLSLTRSQCLYFTNRKLTPSTLPAPNLSSPSSRSGTFWLSNVDTRSFSSSQLLHPPFKRRLRPPSKGRQSSARFDFLHLTRFRNYLTIYLQGMGPPSGRVIEDIVLQKPWKVKSPSFSLVRPRT